MILLKYCWIVLALMGTAFADEDEFYQSDHRAQTKTNGFASPWAKFIHQSTFRLYASFMGPNLGNPTNQTYNVYLNQQAPLQNFYGLSLTTKLGDNYALGLRQAFTHQFTGAVTSNRGTVYPLFKGYDPQAYVNLSNFLPNPYLSSFIQLHIQPPTTSYSKNSTMILAWGYFHSWGIKAIKYPFSGGVKYFINPYYYRKSMVPPLCENCQSLPRQIMYASWGHFLNYSLDKEWQISTSSVFGYERLTGAPGSFAKAAYFSGP